GGHEDKRSKAGASCAGPRRWVHSDGRVFVIVAHAPPGLAPPLRLLPAARLAATHRTACHSPLIAVSDHPERPEAAPPSRTPIAFLCERQGGCAITKARCAPLIVACTPPSNTLAVVSGRSSLIVIQLPR